MIRLCQGYGETTPKRPRRRVRAIVLVVMTLCALGLDAGAWQRKPGAPVLGYQVVNTYPHDKDAFTQGLLFRDGALFESTGVKGRSTLRKVRLETGEVLQQATVDNR